MWVPLDALAVSEAIHNDDDVEAVRDVRAAVAEPPPPLDVSGVLGEADPDWRRVEIRLPRLDGAAAEFGHGDGYTAIVTPIAEYHGYARHHAARGTVVHVCATVPTRGWRFRGSVGCSRTDAG